MKALKVSQDIVTAEFDRIQDADDGKVLTSAQAKTRLGLKK